MITILIARKAEPNYAHLSYICTQAFISNKSVLSDCNKLVLLLTPFINLFFLCVCHMLGPREAPTIFFF